MALELGKINVTDLKENDYKVLGIGINKSSNQGGMFTVNYTTLTQAKDNIINLLMTKKGERVSQPEFGCDIWKVLFEPIVDGDIDDKIEISIIDSVSKWLPYITVDEIIVDYDDIDTDNNRIDVEINFSLTSNPNLRETVKVNINN
jgi:phage baseplate assembly protein W